MKRIFILIMVCFCVAFYGVAQVKNHYGQDVVRKIDVYLPHTVKPYITIQFKYNDDFELQGISFDAPATGKIIWNKNGDELTRTDYDSDGFIEEDVEYRFKVKNNLIVGCIRDNFGLNGSILRYVYNYKYDWDNKMVSINRNVFHCEENQDFVELSDRYKEVFEWDVNGNVYTSTEIGWQWKKEKRFEFPILFDNRDYYDNIINNTNIDLPLLEKAISNFQRIELATEWCGKHSLYFVNEDNGWYFDYTFENDYGGNDLSDDNNVGKLQQMDVYNTHKTLENTYKIYYLE